MLRKWIFALCVLVTTLIALVDYLTGYEITFGPFYFAPIICAAIFVSTFASMTLVVLSTLAWWFADRYAGHNYTPHWVLYWALGMRLFSFAIVGLLASLPGRLLGFADHENKQEVGVEWIKFCLNVAARFIYRCRRGYPLTGREYENRGLQLMAQADYREAIAAFAKTIEMNPKIATAYCHRGTALAALGRHEEAIDDFSRAIEINPKYGWAYYKRGYTLNKVGRSEAARTDLDKAKSCTSSP